MSVFPNGLKTRPRITSPYGWRVHPITRVRTFHSGTDSVGHPRGLNYAPEGGLVTFARYNGAGGNEVRIKTGSAEHRLKHHARIDVAVGQIVGQARATGPTGTTGASTGVHCHAEVWVGGSTVDPYPYIAARLSSVAGGGGGIVDRPESTPAPSQKGKLMQVLITVCPSMPDSDPRISKLKSYQGGDTLTNFTKGTGVIALVGDSPGTRANVQVTQSDRRGNEWAADHTGSLPAGYGVEQAARPYEFDAFLSLLDAYASGGVGSPAGDVTMNLDDSRIIAALEANAARVEAAVDRLNPPDRV